MPLSKYEFHKQLVVRTPVHSLNARNRDWKEIIQDPTFMEAVSISSQSLYQKLIQVREDLDHVSDADQKKLQQSVMKYWSRMCTRTTPFGLFASVGVAEWSRQPKCLITLNNNKIKRKTRLDMSYLLQLAMHIEEDAEINCHLKFFPNSSIYIMGDEYRFLESENIETRQGYKITAVSKSSHLNKVLKQAESGVTLIELLDNLCDEYGISDQDAFLYISELVDSQILVSELEPTVTGSEYFNHILTILRRLRSIPSANRIYRILKQVEKQFQDMDKQIWNSPEAYQLIVSKLNVFGVKPDQNRLIQVDSFSDFSDARLSHKYQENLKSGITALARLQNPKKNDDLNRFIHKFNERYEGQTVSLSEALDTETGIGYANSHSSDLLELGDGVILPELADSLASSWDAFETWAFKRLNAANSGDTYEVELSDETLHQFPDHQYDMPPSMAVMFRVLDESEGDVLIESVGGSSGINLLGRFAHGSEEIHEIMKEVARKEEDRNPDVVFAEIAHLPESRTGNILQRPAVRPYEIPYLAKSSVEGDFQVNIQDLYIKIVKGKIHLWSHKLQKRVIPRLSTAHNFRISDLPVYKFLCDLQTHENNSTLGFSWGSLTELFTFFPRVKYKNTILSPAQWRFNAEDMESLKTAADHASLRFNLGLFRQKWKLPHNIVLADGDNELVLDLTRLDDVQLLIDNTKNRKSFVIKEALGLTASQIKDVENQGHTNQFLTCLLREEQSYMSIAREQFMPLKNRRPVPRKFSPGSEWVYYKMYCGERTSDTLLSEMVKPTVSQLLAENLIDEWFFIRFYDDDPHLRFRVHLKDQSSFGTVVNVIASNLQPFEDQKLVWKTELSCYEREMNRYGHDTIVEAERFFYHDSQAVLKTLDLENQMMDEEIRWKYALKAMEDTFTAFHLNDAQRLVLLERYRDAFMDEFNIDKKAKYELDVKYRKYQSEIQELLNNSDHQEELGLKAIADERLEEISKIADQMLEIRARGGSDWLPGLVGSMIHMTVNRLMMSRQRFYEMIMYYFMAKYYKSKIARAKKIKSVA